MKNEIIIINQFRMISVVVLFIILYWTGTSLFAYKNAKRCFARARKLQAREIPEIYNPYIRKNITPEHEKNIIIGCFTRFPFQFFIMTSFLATLAFLAALKYYIKFPVKIIEIYRKAFGRLVFKTCVKTVEQFDAYQRITTPIIISNHSCWLEIIYYGVMPHLISSVAKQELSKMPIANFLTYYYRSIFVTRQSSTSRFQTLQKIKERARLFENKQQQSPLVIYPEGTVSNGKSLLKFKSGAFEPLKPITMISFQFQCESFDPQMADVKLVECYCIVLALRPSLRVKKAVIHPIQGEKVQQYQERCRESLAKMGNFTKYESSFNEFKQFLNFVADSPDGYKKML